jgi:hypothetical protein
VNHDADALKAETALEKERAEKAEQTVTKLTI